MPHPALHAVVHGRVQGVGFRWSAAGEARRLGLGGWVRNLPDGTVEVLAVGPEAKLTVFHRWLERGPTPARVDRVDVRRDSRDSDPDTFTIRT